MILISLIGTSSIITQIQQQNPQQFIISNFLISWKTSLKNHNYTIFIDIWLHLLIFILAGNKMKEKVKDQREDYQEKIGIRLNDGSRKIMGFLTNFKTKVFKDKQNDNEERMAVLCYFQSEEGELIKCMLPQKPYFYVGFERDKDKEVQAYLESKLEKIQSIEVVEKVDLEQINHLSGRKKQYLKVNFRTTKDLINARAPIKSLLEKRRKQANEDQNLFYSAKGKEVRDITDFITGIREFDVPFHSRVCIDTGLRAGKWFEVQIQDKIITSLRPAPGQRGMPDLKILSFDIETSKDPLKFPDVEKDEVMMISLMYEGQAFLIINRGFCGHDVKPFDYEPKPQFACHVTVFNEPTEKQTLLRFGKFLESYNPNIVTTYNGDKFDYPFLQRRYQINFLKFTLQTGVSDQGGEFYGLHVAHMDCFCWVQRDAFLPQGSRGLKAVTKAKLNYDPIEVDPEEMVWYARNSTQRLAEYSVSDAVATYFLYMKHIHGFIFALATIIPMFPDEVLRKGSGTLCQNLLMAEAYNRDIIFPNKKIEDIDKYYKGNLLDTQTYTGGKVECLRTGVYRADFLTDFTLSPKAFQELIDGVEDIVKFAVRIEMSENQIQNITNMEQVKNQIVTRLQKLRNVKNPHKHEAYPLIYHIDVAAMYPNIILTNRLQPVSIVNDQICSGCLFNQPQSLCKRQLQWEWRGSVFPLNEGQYLQIRQKIISKSPSQIDNLQLQKAIKAEVKAYSQRIYKRTHIDITQTRSDVVCMRENSFYVDTVRAFRDRRYEYKHLAKVSENNYKAMMKAKDGTGAKQAEGLMILYESMQLAHKIILNSFYGYVMRKGARWYSMEMAAMVTYLGSNIISDSRNFIEGRIGKPLQLDTDGIWMLLPDGFPEDVKINFKSGKVLKLSYPCHILNHLIYDKYANDQYQWLQDNKQWRYGYRKEMTIFFEIDGPYKAMMIPAAKEKQKTTQLDIQEHITQLLKKRYVVFNFNNTIKQFKGFEMKRRGELRITKVFQEEIFPQYLKGGTLQQCYAQCATIAKKYLAIIQMKGQAMDTSEILDYLQESRVLSKDLTDYGVSKGVAINSARRLAEFLGPEVVKGKGGLCCYFVISRHPQDRPVTERAIPTQIFDADMEVQRQFLLRWTHDDTLLKGEVDIRNILDWNYYFERLSTQVQKMVCIPAVLQGISNPVPEIQLPEWLQKKTFDMRHHRQQKLQGFIQNKFINNRLVDGSIKKDTSHRKALQAQPKDLSSHSSNLKPQLDSRNLHRANPHSMMKNFKLWLNDQKKIWRERKSENSYEVERPGELKCILQIIPEKTAGNFNIWYWSAGRVQQLLLTMKRKYYCGGKGNKKAPREEGEAIQIVVDESVFKESEDYFQAFLGKKFYQTRLPLETSLIMKKGNIWKMTKQSMTYKQDDIQEVFGEYLTGLQRTPLPLVYLYHEKVIGSRSIWSLYIPKHHEYVFGFVQNSKGAKYDQLLILARKILKNNDKLNADTAKISILQFTEEKQAAATFNKKLETLMNQLKQKFMVVLRAESIAIIQQYGVTFLLEDSPVLQMERVKVENPEILDWKKKALKAILQDNCSESLNQLLTWARYAQIPLCNLQSGPQLLSTITNIQLGRLLHAGDQITWWNQYNSDLTTTYESIAFTGKIVNPGIFSNYCMLVAMENMAVNTVAIAEDLGLEDRQTAGLVKKINNNNATANKWQSLNEMSQVKKAFEYVRKMVKLWVKEYEQNQSECASNLLKHFHKWISTQSGALYDPLLTRLVNELMKKVFHLLARRLEQLGLHLVHANFTKLLVATDKHTSSEARSCVEYALRKCVQDNQKLFKYIGLTPSEQLYKAFAFRDQFNFVGVLERGGYYYKLQSADLMSPPIAKYFKLLLIQLVQRIAGLQDELLTEFGSNRMQLFLDYEKLLLEGLNKYLRGDFIDTLIEVLRKLHNDWEKAKQIRKNQALTDHQSSAGQESEKENAEQNEEVDSFIDDGQYIQEQKAVPAPVQEMELEYGETNELETLVQNLYYFLNSGQNIRDSLYTIRKTAMLELKMEPSLDYGAIKPVYASFQLPCTQCYLVNQQPGHCEHCEAPLHCKSEMERSVWKMMHEQGRDLYCDRCNRIKQDYLRKCHCGGKWVLRQFPLKWVEFAKRQGEEWTFINQVFEFMGIVQ